MAAMSKEEFITMVEGMTVLELHEIVKASRSVSACRRRPPSLSRRRPARAPARPRPWSRRRPSSTSSSPVSAPTRSRSSRSSASSPGSGLKEAKDLVEGVPKPVKEAVAKKDAEDMKKKLADAGGTADIK